MKLLLTIISVFFLVVAGRPATFYTNTPPDADAFVRALEPTLNYGGGGALSISGTNTQTGAATNGAFDSFMRFNTADMVSNFNTVYGPGNWVITSAVLNLTENPLPGNPVFNFGTGLFDIRWFDNDIWIEGTGTPKAPTTDGISYSQEPSLLTNTADLGAFSFAAAQVTSCALGLPAAFVNDLRAGGEVSLYLTAVDASIGFVFYSRSFNGQPAVRPALVVSALPQPVLVGAAVAGADIVLSATNGVSGETYEVLSSITLSAPASQWTPILANTLASGGPFVLTLTNAAGVSPRYFILQAQ